MVLHIYRPGSRLPIAGPLRGDARSVTHAARRYEREHGPCVVVLSDDDATIHRS